MSQPKHSVTIVPAGAVWMASGSQAATFQASCLCGWRADQAYRLHSRAARAYYRHLEAA